MLHVIKRRALQFPAQGLREDVKLIELDDRLLTRILAEG
jgi:hypothetical protein